jgi:uncharacterized protein YkwD
MIAAKATFALVLALSTTGQAGPPDGSAAGPPRTGKQQREINRLVIRFRRARRSQQTQMELLEKAMRMGPAAVAALSETIGKQMQPQLERYRNRFQEQAAAVTKQQVGKADPQEIARLRAAVLVLRGKPNLSKQDIRQHADPAMKRLGEVFLVRRSDVLARSKSLPKARLQLLQSARLWELCAVYLYRALPPGETKPDQPPSFERYLQGEEELAIGLSVPMPPATVQVLAANARLASRLDPEEARTILSLNLTRNLLGLTPVATDLKLCAAARDHSQDMRRLQFFAHQSPVPGKATVWDRAQRFGTTASGENIYMGATDGFAANLAWFHSPPHHKNMLASHNRVGVGRAGAYFTELFGR